MVFILINWLFNGFLLSFIYLLGLSFTDIGKYVYSSGWLFLWLGYGTTGLLTIIGISRLGHYFLRMFLGGRYAIGRERDRIDPLLQQVLDQANSIHDTKYKLSKLHIMIDDTKEPNAQAFGRVLSQSQHISPNIDKSTFFFGCQRFIATSAALCG